MVRSFSILALVAALSGIATGQQKNDWAQWRGSERNGLSVESVALLDKFEKLEPVWRSEAVNGHTEGGYASPVVSGGRVYINFTPVTTVPIELEFTGHVMNVLGAVPEGVEDALLEKLDTGRKSLAEIKDGRERKTAAGKWVNENLSEEERKLLGGFAIAWAEKGENALTISTLRKVATLKDKKFADQAPLDAWFAENAIEKSDQEIINKAIPRTKRVFDECVLCLDAATGKTLWKKVISPGHGTVQWGGGSSTPLVTSEHLYFLTADGIMYCLDIAKEGEIVWKTQLAKFNNNNDATNSSPLLLDGKIFVQSMHLYALDAKTGEILWGLTEGEDAKKVQGANCSPMPWKVDGKTYVLSGNGRLGCVEPESGEVLWSVGGGTYSTPVVAGDVMAVTVQDKPALFYRISEMDAEALTKDNEVPNTRGSSFATDGNRFYMQGKTETAAFDAKSLAELWRVKNNGDHFGSPIVADGKLIGLSDKSDIWMLDAATGDMLGKFPAEILTCTSPVLVDGFLYIRGKENIICYDLRKDKK